MARILINESDERMRRLLVRMVARLRHRPVTLASPEPGYLDGVDLLIVEPAAASGALFAKAAHASDPALPVVCASVAAPPEIDVPFAARLVKPFTLDELREAIDWGLAWGVACRHRGGDGDEDDGAGAATEADDGCTP
ncbi:MAG TPA: hypothetical protein VMU32_10360 [Solirubrobacteraceae bacterium]|nr:hypothetical protein [Solirubrobacteraceae bacterium]